MTSSHIKSHILRQVAGTAISGSLSFSAGFSFGFSALLLPELKNDENFPYNDDLASWIASISPLSMVIGCICAGSLIDGFGRKFGHIIVTVLSIICWLIMASATNATLLLVGRSIAGIATGATKPISLVYIGEITSPKYRRFSLVCPSLTLTLGVLVSHAIGGFISWKSSSYLYAAYNFLCLICMLFFKESPLWLISKGKNDEGIQAFEWFRGNESDAEKELNLVLQRQSEKTEKYLLKDILSRSFIKPFLTSILLAAATQFNGLNSLTFYAQDTLGNTVQGEVNPFILMIVFDFMRLVTFLLIICCAKFIPRRIFFLGVGFGCSAVLFGLYACLSFINVSDYVWLSITLIILFVVFGGSTFALAWTFVPELFSGNLRGLGSGISSSISSMFLFVFVKISPGLITSYGEKFMYGGFCLITVINTTMLCFLLPETNGRTLQDIEDSYKKNNITVSSL